MKTKSKVSAAVAVCFAAGAAAAARRLRTDFPELVPVRERLLRVAAEFDLLQPLVEAVPRARHPLRAYAQLKRLQLEVASLMLVLDDDDNEDQRFWWPAMLADAFNCAATIHRLRS